MAETPETPRPTGSRSFGERLIGALKLDPSVYEEVEHDPDAMGQAAMVVALGAVAAAIGAMGSGGAGVLGGIMAAFLGWAFGAGVVWLVGVQVMGHSSDYPELLRTLGFASAPRVLLVVGFIPALRGLAGLAVLVLSLIAWVIAVRQALDVETGRAVLVCVLAFLMQIAIGFVLAAIGLGGLMAAA